MLRIACLLLFVAACGATESNATTRLDLPGATQDDVNGASDGDGNDASSGEDGTSGSDGSDAGADSASGADSSSSEEDAGSTPTSDASVDGPDAPGVFTLTSSAYEEGGIIPERHTCNGEELSPPLAWNDAPEGTLSYALIYTDLQAMIPGDDHPFIHWAMWDIPGDFSALDEGIPDGANPAYPPGASQVRGWSALGGAIGGSAYLGPCPREPHDYEFALYALSVEELEGVSTNQQPAEIWRAVEASGAVLGKATLTGHYDPP